jgi:hypothetical protein
MLLDSQYKVLMEVREGLKEMDERWMRDGRER